MIAEGLYWASGAAASNYWRKQSAAWSAKGNEAISRSLAAGGDIGWCDDELQRAGQPHALRPYVSFVVIAAAAAERELRILSATIF